VKELLATAKLLAFGQTQRFERVENRSAFMGRSSGDVVEAGPVSGEEMLALALGFRLPYLARRG